MKRTKRDYLYKLDEDPHDRPMLGMDLVLLWTNYRGVCEAYEALLDCPTLARRNKLVDRVSVYLATRETIGKRLQIERLLMQDERLKLHNRWVTDNRCRWVITNKVTQRA